MHTSLVQHQRSRKQRNSCGHDGSCWCCRIYRLSVRRDSGNVKDLFDNPNEYLAADIPDSESGIGVFKHIYYRAGYQVGKTDAEVRAAVMHELLHNMGFTDTEIQKGLGLEVSDVTDNITQELKRLCF